MDNILSFHKMDYNPLRYINIQSDLRDGKQCYPIEPRRLEQGFSGVEPGLLTPLSGQVLRMTTTGKALVCG